jgi:hypothetical protein
VVVWFHGRVQDTAGLSVLTKPLNDVRLAFCFKRGRSVSERWFNVSCILTQGFHYDGQGTKVPTRFSDDIPEIEAVADGAHGVFAIDSGNSGSLVIHATFGNSSGLAEQLSRGLSLTSFGAGGESQNWINYLDRFEIAGTSLRHVLARYANDNKGGVLFPDRSR